MQAVVCISSFMGLEIENRSQVTHSSYFLVLIVCLTMQYALVSLYTEMMSD